MSGRVLVGWTDWIGEAGQSWSELAGSGHSGWIGSGRTRVERKRERARSNSLRTGCLVGGRAGVCTSLREHEPNLPGRGPWGGTWMGRDGKGAAGKGRRNPGPGPRPG
jgi:hypothetical protein